MFTRNQERLEIIVISALLSLGITVISAAAVFLLITD